MTVLFWFLSAGLAAAAIGFIVWPLVRSIPSARMDRRTATLAAHRARLLEIKEGESDGAPSDPDLGQEVRDDVARALLRDLALAAAPDRELPEEPRPRRGAAAVLGVAVPALAAVLYIWLGEPGALHPAAATGAQVERLLEEAESIARAGGDRLEGEPARLIERALVLAPDHRKALWFAAIAALHEDRAEDARDRLERLRGLGPFDEDETRMFERLMTEATARLPEP